MVRVRQFYYHCAYSWCHHGSSFGAGGGTAAAGADGATYNYNGPNYRNSYALHATTGCATATYPCGPWCTIAYFSLSDERIHAAAATATTTTTAAASAWHSTFLDYGCDQFADSATIPGSDNVTCCACGQRGTVALLSVYIRNDIAAFTPVASTRATDLSVFDITGTLHDRRNGPESTKAEG